MSKRAKHKQTKPKPRISLGKNFKVTFSTWALGVPKRAALATLSLQSGTSLALFPCVFTFGYPTPRPCRHLKKQNWALWWAVDQARQIQKVYMYTWEPLPTDTQRPSAAPARCSPCGQIPQGFVKLLVAKKGVLCNRQLVGILVCLLMCYSERAVSILLDIFLGCDSETKRIFVIQLMTHQP